MGSKRSKSRYADVLRELGFHVANKGSLPESMRRALPTIPDKPTFLRISDDEEEVYVTIVMDETGVCWIGDVDAPLAAQGFNNFTDARARATN